MFEEKLAKEQQFTTLIHKKEWIMNELKKRGYKITPQRTFIIDILLNNRCSSCKEVYYQLAVKDEAIGIATVYRMIKILEEIGVIDKNKLFQISYDNLSGILEDQIILIDEENTTEINVGEWYDQLKQTLVTNGLIGRKHKISVIIKKMSL